MSDKSPEEMAAELMQFRHTGDDPPTNVMVNGVRIMVDDDSRMVDVAAQIRNARSKSD